MGLLMGSAGVGALASATYLALQPGYSRQLRLLSAAPLFVGLALMLFALSQSVPISMVLLACMAASLMLTTNSINVILQQSTPDEWRGRVIGLYAMSFAGTAPLGSLLAGVIAARIGIPATLALNGLLVIAAGLVARWRLHNHPEAMRTLMRSLRAH